MGQLTKILNEIKVQNNIVDSFLKVGDEYYIQDRPNGYKARVAFLGKTKENERVDGTGKNFIIYNFKYDVTWGFDYEELDSMIKNKLITKIK